VFAALKFEPTDDFTTVYKYDLTRERGTPVATGFVGFNPATPLIGPLMSALVSSQPGPVYVDTRGRRPKVVNNSYAIPFDQKVFGHSLTSTWRPSDAVIVRNIAAYRESRVFSASPIDGLSALTLTPQALGPYATFIAFSTNPALATLPQAAQAAAIQQVAASLAPAVGSPLIIIGAQPSLRSKQWSDELQVNYDSRLLTLTAGGLWFRSEDRSGLVGMQNTTTFTVIPGGVVPLGRQGLSFNKATSIAAYVQAELHATSQLDLVGGYRITRDHKTGNLVFGTSPGLTTFNNPDYKKSRPTYLLGANFKPAEDMLVYAKYSTGFVSGGQVATVAFEPETVKSWEGGIKADFLDRRLRTNLAVYRATYRHFQSAQGSTNFANLLGPLTPFIGTFVIDAGTVKAKGFEFEGSAAPVRGLTMGGSVGYMDTEFSNTPQVLINQSGGVYAPTFRPKWTVGLWGQYESDPVIGDASVVVRMDANWRSRSHLDSNPDRNVPQFAVIRYVPSAWLLNARLALRGFQVGGAEAELAVWGRNLTNNRDVINGVLNGFEAAAFYEAARTVGVDLAVRF
jgi:iron complex outermembrane receptor protein